MGEETMVQSWPKNHRPIETQKYDSNCRRGKSGVTEGEKNTLVELVRAVVELGVLLFYTHKHNERNLILERQLVNNLFTIILWVSAAINYHANTGIQRPEFDYIKCQDYLNFQNKVPDLY